MSDLFHPDVPDDFRVSVFDVMATAWANEMGHQFQVLTKRPRIMATWVADYYNGRCEMPYPNVWLGSSIELDKYAFRADYVRGTPAAVRFLSLEPLLGPLPSLDLTDIDWVIVGGESGRGARPMDAAWVRDLRDQCVEVGVAFFFKQWGAQAPDNELDGRRWEEYPRDN